MITPAAPAPPPIPPIPPAVTPPVAGKTDAAALLDEPAATAWWRRWTVWLAVGLGLAAVAGFWYWRHASAVAAEPVYTTATVARGDLTLIVTANGTLQPTQTTNIGSELSGTVLKVNVDVNDVVKKGQVMVVLDPAKLKDQVLRSRATLASAQGKVLETAATIGESSAALGRLEAVAQLSGGKVPAKTELDTARATLSRSIADDASARALVQDALAALSTDQINLSKSSIAAPSDGVVLTRTVDPGNAVAASLQAVTLFTVAQNINKLRLWVYVDEADVGAVKLGQDATFTVSAYLTRNYPAKITRVGLGSTITDNVVTYLTYLDVDNADLALRPGMTATATITATQVTNVLLVPNSALRFTPTDNTATTAKKGATASLLPRMPGSNTRRSAAEGASTATAKQVWVLPASDKNDGTGTPVAVAVVPGISDGHMTQIISGDLKAGMLVVTAIKVVKAP